MRDVARMLPSSTPTGKPPQAANSLCTEASDDEQLLWTFSTTTGVNSTETSDKSVVDQQWSLQCMIQESSLYDVASALNIGQETRRLQQEGINRRISLRAYWPSSQTEMTFCNVANDVMKK